MEDLSSVETTVSGPCLVAKVRGVMDYVTQLELRGRLTQAIDRAERAVVLDLAEVSFCDSAGLNVLLGARREAERAAVVLVLACVPVTLRRILEMTGADQVLRVFATVADAEAALSS
ncbi:STAS domain-containing protein [Streptomyces roseolus]|uniref:STAS domain-containing protein n=1 Tax=Streptomyces roseolus TaxID=67358 RepID=UPI0036EFEDA7